VAGPGDVLFLNDGLIELEVLTVAGHDVTCRVRVGGELRSRKGLNLPGIDLGIRAFTERDRECLAFALAEGVDVISQSFVESPEDVAAVREAAAAMGHHPFVVAKIERARALDRVDEILGAADAVMIARGDLGVEVPIERIALVQKDIARKANVAGKPVITATQMLESMTRSRRPTRAEATDVANAILDGTDAVMLSEESATGAFPVDAVSMLARIAAAIEPHRPAGRVREALGRAGREGPMSLRDVIASSVDSTLERASPAAVLVPTDSGATARSVARFRPPVWIAAISTREETCRRLQLSWGVHALHVAKYPEDWKTFARAWLRENGIEGNRVVLTEGPSPEHPEANHRMEIIDLDGDS
jgi:pyruvate kinase